MGYAIERNSKSAYLQGNAFAITNISGYIKGSNISIANKSAFILGGVTEFDKYSAYVEGYSAGGSISDSKAAFVLGIDNLLVPDGFISKTGVWKNELGSESNLWLSIDETEANDTDYIWNPDPTVNDYIEFTLTNPVSTPGSGDVVIFWRGKDKSASGSVMATVQLRQGASTVIATTTVTLTSKPTTYYLQLTAGEKANITDWNDLRIRISRTTLAGYFVAPNGNDSWAGDIDHPWLTIQYGLSQIYAGDTLWIRGGTYTEALYAYHAGTEASPVMVSAYPNEIVTVDGNATYPTTAGSLLLIEADWYTFKDIRFTNCKHISDVFGVQVNADHVTLTNIIVYEVWDQGISFRGDYGIAEYCTVYHACLNNYQGLLGGGGGWGSGIDLNGFASPYPTNNIIRHCITYENWGEGINAGHNNYATVEDCISYDNYAVNLYITDATNILCQRNLVYTTGYMDTWDGNQGGIQIGDEAHAPESSGITIINNLVYGTHTCFYWWENGAGYGITNLLVANNTFVNSHTTATIKMEDSTGHSNVNIKNNIVRQDDSLPVAVAYTNSEVHFDYNCWSKTAPPAAQGVNDITADPDLAETDNYDNPLWYKILATSPCRGEGTPLVSVTDDYWEIERADPPCIGAHEYV